MVSSGCMPVMGDPTIKGLPMAFLLPHERRAELNHSQSLSRLADRGGLGLDEVYCIITDQPLSVLRGKPAFSGAAYRFDVIDMLLKWVGKQQQYYRDTIFKLVEIILETTNDFDRLVSNEPKLNHDDRELIVNICKERWSNA